jgi:hypothetical protein
MNEEARGVLKIQQKGEHALKEKEITSLSPFKGGHRLL